MSQNNQPVYKVREGGISSAVFDGQYGFSVSFQKWSKNRETGEEKTQQAWLNPNDLLKAIFVLEEAKRWISAQPDKPKVQTPAQNRYSQLPQQQYAKPAPPNPPVPVNPHQGGMPPNGGAF